MPWLPELFTAPALQRVLDERRRESLVAVPYFDGLLSGDPEPLVDSFVGEPQVHDPLRGRVRGEEAFRAFVSDSSAWLREHHAQVDDVEHVILERHGFEEVVVHLDTEHGRIDLPVAVVADRRADGRIEEVRVYFATAPLTGRGTHRPPLLQADRAVRVPKEVADFYASSTEGGEVGLEPCALVDDGRAGALELNVVRTGTSPPTSEAAIAVFVRSEHEEGASVRAYADPPPYGG
jgi:hypothetical protein